MLALSMDRTVEITAEYSIAIPRTDWRSGRSVPD